MRQASALPILMYHHVSPNPGLVTVSPETFHHQIARLAAAGYRSVGASELEAFLSGQPLPEKSVMLSFDDGYFDNYRYAHPVLREFGFKAVLFLITGWLGDGEPRHGKDDTPSHGECKRRIAAGRADEVMLRWSEVAEMQSAGSFEFHSHTHTHTRWDREISNLAVRDSHLAEDLAKSRAMLVQRLGTCSRHLCWPQGYYDDAYRRVAVGAGFDHLYTVARGSVTPTTDNQQLPRVVVKDKAGVWLNSRLWLYRRPWLADAYLTINGSLRSRK